MKSCFPCAHLKIALNPPTPSPKKAWEKGSYSFTCSKVNGVHEALFVHQRAGRWFTLAVGVLLLFGIWRHHTAMRSAIPAVTPTADAVFTSTRYTTCLLIALDGEVWAGTLGGILRRSGSGTWQKFTRMDGLPANEVRGLEWRKDTIVAEFPMGGMTWRNGSWQPIAAEERAQVPSPVPDQTCAAVWQGRNYAATLAGLRVQAGNKWQTLPQPPSNGTHITALLPQNDSLLVALFGDGLWAWNGRDWRRVNIGLPPEAREITALAGSGEHLWLGTRRAGIWEYTSGYWKAHQLAGEPVDHNCQALRMVGGSLWVSTLEDGMAVRTTTGWGHYSAGALSSNSPRQMVLFGNALYLRHGNGKVDQFANGRWERNVFSGLPRREVSALAADEHHLYVGQWGGWSEFDGQAWTHHLDVPELQGLPVTALCPQKDTLWIGTQRRGLAEYSHSSYTLRWHDERNGVADDWITTLACIRGKIYAGTFVGGLAEWNGAAWTSPKELNGENVTALEPDSTGGFFVATRQDVWHQSLNGDLKRIRPTLPGLYQEAQALCYVPGGLWIGTRTGLVFCADNGLQAWQRQRSHRR